MRTWIYLIKDSFTGFYKIGKSLNPYKRLKELERQPTKMPIAFDLKLVEAWRGDSSTESDLHRMFANERQRGEWFVLSNEHIEYLFERMDALPKLSTGMSASEEREHQAFFIEESTRDLAEKTDWLDFSFEGLGVEF